MPDDLAYRPTITPVITDIEPRCGGCNKLLAEVVSRPWRIRCTRSGCKSMNVAGEWTNGEEVSGGTESRVPTRP